MKPLELPVGWSSQAVDFINRLIRRKPDHRLGSRGMSEVKGHPWLHDIDWKKLISKEVRSPFNVDVSVCVVR